MTNVATDALKTLPRPAPDRAFYEATLEAGFRRFPERRANYEKYRASTRTEVLDHLPVRLDIENVSRCNYHCTMCQVSDWPGLKRADDMSLEDFKRLLEGQYGVVEIKLQGMGEPFLGTSYVEMVAYARAQEIWVRSTTNASLLHLNHNAQRIIDADICELQVSIDGATPATYEAIRRGGRFERVAESCRLLNRYAREVNRKRTRMWTVVQEGNYAELEQFPVLAADLGFERLTLSLDLNDWGQERWRAVNDPLDVHERFDRSRAHELVETGKGMGVEVTFWFIDEKYDTDDPAHLCQWPFERTYVSSDMRIVPCCMIGNPQVVDLGDARDFMAAWNDKKMRAFRRLHLGGKIPKVCQTCYKQRAAGETPDGVDGSP